jgi:serine/threonine-protein kinase HipA
MSQVLDVYLLNELAGELYTDSHQHFVFKYHPEWVDSHNAQPLSLSLPVRKEAYEDDRSHPFFANLLPEAEIRVLLAKKLGLSESNDFSLLEAIGGECAGAVSLYPQGENPPERLDYRALDDKELNQLVTNLPSNPMLAGEQEVRLSLAGAQNKLPVLFKNNIISLPLGSAASSHILKPPILHYPDTVQNECFCMQLADRIGLNVPATQILHKEQPLYIIDRYDRFLDPSGWWLRTAQEDFCQAMAISPSHKYEKEGGPTLKACFELIRRESIQPAKDLTELLNWVIFNFLIGNADAHGKNISLLLTQDGPKLAPFYDLMSTAIYPQLSKNMAMAIGGETRPDWIIKRRWEQFSLDTGINIKLVCTKALSMAKVLSDQAEPFSLQFQQQQGENESIKKIVALIEKRAQKINIIFEAANR